MKCSVILVTHNRPDFFIMALRSLYYQTATDFEVIAVNDGKFNCEEIVKVYGKDRTQYIRHAKNKGLGGARNTGLKLAQGKYILFLDDDDVLYPDHLAQLMKKLDKDSSPAVAYTDFKQVFHVENSGKRWIEAKSYSKQCGEFSKSKMITGNFIPVCCLMFHKSILDQVGVFDETLESHEDWDLWVRMAKKDIPFYYIKGETCEISWRPNTMTANSNIMHSGRAKVIKKIQKY